MNEPSIRLTIDSHIQNVRLVGAAVHRLCGLTPLSKEAAHRVELCVTEAVVNCIKHAYGSRPDHSVSTTLILKPEELMITVSDQGLSMNPELVEALAAAPAQKGSKANQHRLSTSGRGLNIMVAFMDHVTYRSAAGHNHLIMRKLTDNRETKHP